MSSRLHLDRWAASVAAGVAGGILNCYPLLLPGGATLTFGEIFSLLVALTLGPFFGMLTAALVELPSLIHSMGGGVMLVHVLEACAIGLMVRRRLAPLYASALFWLILATPMILCFGHSWLGIPAESLRTVASKNILNGLISVTVADLMSGWSRMRRWLRVGSLLFRYAGIWREG